MWWWCESKGKTQVERLRFFLEHPGSSLFLGSLQSSHGSKRHLKCYHEQLNSTQFPCDLLPLSIAVLPGIISQCLLVLHSLGCSLLALRFGHSGMCLSYNGPCVLGHTRAFSQMLSHRQGLALGHWVKMKWKNQNSGMERKSET